MNNILPILIDEARQDTAYVGTELLKLAKKRYPLTRLMRLLGDGQQITTGGRPCHLCNAPGAMFRMFQPGGRWTFSCTGKCGQNGDQIDYLKAKFNLSDGEAIRLLSKLICP
jgi:hypothetical protein